MAEPSTQTALQFDPAALADWIPQQRWYGSKTHSLSSVEVADEAPLGDELLLALVQTKLATGMHQNYQVPLGVASDGSVSFDPLADPATARSLLGWLERGGDLETDHGSFYFRHVGEGFRIAGDATVRSMGVEQSNTSIVFGDQLVLKLFRRLEPGINPELEILRFLTANGYQHIAPLHAWYEYEGPSLAATLGIVQRFVPDAVDGWTLALDEIVSAPETFIARAASLGSATAALHNALASDSGDPAFSPEEPSNEGLALLTAKIDEDIEQLFVRLPDDPQLDPIRDRGADVRERLSARPQLGTAGGRNIRIHGDYHLGQALATPHGWVLLDFEGEPSRPLPERRRKRSALRDVASMLRSFSYATSAIELQLGKQAPAEFERRVREAYLTAYLAEIDQALLPPGELAVSNLLAIFELEKAIYELDYELGHRPDWVAIPVAGIVRLLEQT